MFIAHRIQHWTMKLRSEKYVIGRLENTIVFISIASHIGNRRGVQCADRPVMNECDSLEGPFLYIELPSFFLQSLDLGRQLSLSTTQNNLPLDQLYCDIKRGGRERKYQRQISGLRQPYISPSNYMPTYIQLRLVTDYSMAVPCGRRPHHLTILP